MAKTILFAWELGSGLGYVAHLRRLAARLQREGIRIVAVLKNIHAARWLDGPDLDIMQAPLWPVTFMSDAECARLSTATFADTLAGFGLADERALRALLDAWDRLFSLIEPDLVIAEHAPAATLAARGRLPLALVGTGFTLPPPRWSGSRACIGRTPRCGGKRTCSTSSTRRSDGSRRARSIGCPNSSPRTSGR